MTPAPTAVKSVGPPTLNTTGPAPTGLEFKVICVALSTETMRGVEANVPKPDTFVKACPTIMPFVLVTVIWGTPEPHVPLTFESTAALPISIFLSSTVNVFVLTVVVVPLIVRLPVTVKS